MFYLTVRLCLLSHFRSFLSIFALLFSLSLSSHPVSFGVYRRNKDKKMERQAEQV